MQVYQTQVWGIFVSFLGMMMNFSVVVVNVLTFFRFCHSPLPACCSFSHAHTTYISQLRMLISYLN